MTAGLFVARAGRSVAMLTDGPVGGHLLSVTKIDDFPGFPGGVPGYDLCPMIEEQATTAGAHILTSHIKQLERERQRWLIGTNDGEHRADAVVLATGSKINALGVPGEERLLGRGVSHCGSCDGPLFRGRVVGVVGGGDSALQEALELARYVSQVIIFCDQHDLTGQCVYRDAVVHHPTIMIRTRSQIEEIVGEVFVEGVAIRDLETGLLELVELAAVFPFVGLQPQTQFLSSVLQLDASGHVPTDVCMRTAAPGLFAAGDIRRNSAGQAVSAAGDGATAALAAHGYLSGEPWPSQAVVESETWCVPEDVH